MARRLTLIAGSGSLVPLVAEAAKRHGDTLQVLDLVGRGDVSGDLVLPASVSDPAAIIQALRAFRSTHAVLAGGVHLSDSDREAMARAFGPIGKLGRSLGDVGLAGAMLLYSRFIGVTLVGVQEIAADLQAAEDIIAGPVVTAAVRDAAAFALQAARTIGRIDLGQSVVSSGRRVIAAEDAAGTDALIERVGVLRSRGLVGDGAMPLILAKARKPRQPSFVDLPAIGPGTIANAAAVGITVVAVEAKRSLLLDRPALIAAAAEKGVSVIGLTIRNG